MQDQHSQFDPSQLPERMASRITVDENGCWIWTGARTPPRGYGNFALVGGQTRYVHRLAYELLVGPISAGLNVCHICDCPPCCNPSHLFTGTQRDNIRDMMNKGRDNFVGLHMILRGERHSQAILTEDAVRAIRHRYRPGVVSGRMLAKEYGVSTATIQDVLHRRTWSHVL